jgi:hypothetical protein
MIRAIDKVIDISEISGCRLITVDAKKKEKVINFYLSLGFKRVKNTSKNTDSVNMYFDYVKSKSEAD